jgi:hypothetical protein
MEDADLSMRLHCNRPLALHEHTQHACAHAGRESILRGSAADHAALPPLMPASVCEGQQACKQAWRTGLRSRRRIRHVMYRSNVTSGRRMVHWGGLKTTYLHFKFGLMWYFGCSPRQLQKAYDELYTDNYR